MSRIRATVDARAGGGEPSVRTPRAAANAHTRRDAPCMRDMSGLSAARGDANRRIDLDAACLRDAFGMSVARVTHAAFGIAA